MGAKKAMAAVIICAMLGGFLLSVMPEATYAASSISTVSVVSTQKAPKADMPGFLPYAKGTAIPITGIANYDFANEVVRLVNIERGKAGLLPLQMDSRLLDAAMVRVAESIVIWDHKRPDGTKFLSIIKFPYSYAGENMTLDLKEQASPRQVVDSWMRSPTHSENILRPTFTQTGVGVITHGSWTYFIQLFTESAGIPGTKDGTKKETFAVNLGANPYKISINFVSNEPLYSLKAGDIFLLNIKRSNGGIYLANSDFVWTSSNNKVVKANNTGLVTVVSYGKAAITAKYVNKTYGTKTISKTITVKPKEVTGLKSKAGKKKMILKWNRDPAASGYQILYATNSKFTKGKKSITITKNGTVKKTIKKLKKGKTYYVKVRAYKTDGTKIWGPYSATKKVKIK